MASFFLTCNIIRIIMKIFENRSFINKFIIIEDAHWIWDHFEKRLFNHVKKQNLEKSKK